MSTTGICCFEKSKPNKQRSGTVHKKLDFHFIVFREEVILDNGFHKTLVDQQLVSAVDVVEDAIARGVGFLHRRALLEEDVEAGGEVEPGN